MPGVVHDLLSTGPSSLCMCAFFTSNRNFNPVSPSTPSIRADSSSGDNKYVIEDYENYKNNNKNRNFMGKTIEMPAYWAQKHNNTSETRKSDQKDSLKNEILN